MPNDRSNESRTVSLVLGSGGARGLAHIGAIRALEENDVTIDSIAGSSMGAVVGAMRAAGKLEDYAHWVTQLEQSDVFRLVDWTLSGAGQRPVDQPEDIGLLELRDPMRIVFKLSGRAHRADHCPHGAAGDGVDGNVVFLQRPDGPDVCQPARPAGAEDQRDGARFIRSVVRHDYRILPQVPAGGRVRGFRFKV